MNPQNNQPTLDEVINNMRDNILRTQSQSSTASITGYDNLVEQLKIFVNQINAQSTEILRLQELCKKSNIDYTIPAPPPVVLPKNEGVTPAETEGTK